MNEQIDRLIGQYGMSDSFSHIPPTQEMLAEVKEKLGFDVPCQFLEFLNCYSYGGLGFEILGIGFDGSIAFLEETLEYREDGLPGNLLVVENCDEWLYCIDVDTNEIVSWCIDEDPRVDYSCFDDYLLNRLSDTIENL
ncbi:MAG: SMI1/KNR4 family protein [Eggerthellales bacterium]|nr:SMI1/KNR4 family protein [Eggerthellales bacterium]